MKTRFFFDMDHTLIDNDCDVSWKYFAVKHRLADEDALREADVFFEEYQRGTLDGEKFIRFQLREFIGNKLEKMEELSHRHFEEFVKGKIYADAKHLIDSLHQAGESVGILTSTNVILAKPLADFLQADILFGTELELENGCFTGRLNGIYAAGTGKVKIIETFAEENHLNLQDFSYYGDSINDRYILDAVGTAYAVNASEELSNLAQEKNWRRLDFRPNGYFII